ncbi:MAG: hypothetical protein DI536_06075 [Archangium gephyra]|uniref:DUF4347 domain-containing protein n=1 Tax=Archangium gephyra TaxID=48 RepID=A0A2W5TMA9_9BACT|nr:MAG: hypothetical protein DI536_06075 [Archangium gephyra]
MKKGPLRLMVISYPRRLDTVFERSVLSLAKHVGPGFRVERCQEPKDVPWLVRQWRRRGHDVTRLEFLGHGKAGAFSLGDQMFIDATGTGLETFGALGDELAEDARVNLLGCRVARGGQAAWLTPFERALGARRTLWGASSWVSHVAFMHGPISAEVEATLVRAGRSVETPEKRHPRPSGRHTAGRGTHGH